MVDGDVVITDPKAEVKAAIEADRKRREVAPPPPVEQEIPEAVMGVHAMFAAHAMQAMLAPGKGMITSYEKLSIESWSVADEMLAQFIARYGRD